MADSPDTRPRSGGLRETLALADRSTLYGALLGGVALLVVERLADSTGALLFVLGVVLVVPSIVIIGSRALARIRRTPPGVGAEVRPVTLRASSVRRATSVAAAILAGASLALAVVVGDEATRDDEERLVEQLPASVRESCEATGRPKHALAAVSCRDEKAGVEVSYVQFDAADRVKAYLDESVRGRGLGDGTCAYHSRARHSYNVNPARKKVGEIACYTSRARAWLEWTDTGLAIYAKASRSDEKQDVIWQWWRNVPYLGRTLRGWTPAENDLLEHVPDDIAKTCHRYRGRETFAAALTCYPRGVAWVVYASLPGKEALEKRFDQRVRLIREWLRPCDADLPKKYEWERAPDAPAGGDVMCFLEPNATLAYMEWSNWSLGIYSWARREDGKVPSLYRWWLKKAGPW